MEKYGGNPKCIVCDPEIHVVTITEKTDLIMIGSDGIFDKLSTEECVKTMMSEAEDFVAGRKNIAGYDLEHFDHVAEVSGLITDKIL
jgi:serine/threonine protein phosphatase PrpC